jgi:zinc transporter
MSDETVPNGLIHALLLDGKGGTTPLSWASISEWEPGQGCLWLHFNYESPASREWLENSSGLSEIALSALISEETRPRAFNRGDALLLSLRGVNLSPGQDPEDMISLRIWTDGQKVISSRRRKLLSTQDVIDELEAGQGPGNAAELLVAWVDRLVWRMHETIEDLEEQVLAFEDRILSGETEGIRLGIAQLRKRSISIRRYLAPQREAMNRLVNENLSWLGELNRLQLREINDRLIRYIEDIDEVRDRAALTHEELFAHVSEQINERSYVFTVVATIFLPLSFFTGLMGINVGGMPGVEDSTAFWIVVAMCFALTGLLALFFRWKRWL